MPDAPTPSVTTWMRLEPRSRDASMQTSLQARIYDPLWLLARQWQTGEFEGDDSGSPAAAQWRGESDWTLATVLDVLKEQADAIRKAR